MQEKLLQETISNMLYDTSIKEYSDPGFILEYDYVCAQNGIIFH